MGKHLGGPIFMTFPAFSAGGGSGVTPPFVLSKSGNAGVGTYLRTGEAVTNKTGQLIKGINNLVELQISNSNNVGSNTRVQLVRRTSATTFTDITGAYVDISAGTYKGKRAMSIALGPDDEIGAYVASGSTLGDPVLTIYVVPAS